VARSLRGPACRTMVSGLLLFTVIFFSIRSVCS
jgi:hypothetical protein